MVAITDKFGKASIDTDYAVATTVKTTRVIGGTVLECYDLSKFADDTPVYFITYKKTTDPITGEVSVTNQIGWKAIVNTGANTLTNLELAPGYTDTGNAIGDFVECILTSHWGNELVDGILTHTNPDGTLKTSAVQAALNLPAGVSPDWTPLGTAPVITSSNGQREFALRFTGADYTDRLQPGTKLKIPRTVTAPTQSTSLNGTNQYFSKAAPAGMTFTDDFTVSAWVKLSSYPSGNGSVVSRYNGTNGWALDIQASGQVRFVGVNGSSITGYNLVDSYQSIPLNKWVHIAAQLDMSAYTATSTTSYVMIDGVDVPAVVSRGSGNPTALVQAGNLEIGSRQGGLQPFPGKIAQVAIFNAKVAQATIRNTMFKQLVGNETNLVGYWKFNGDANDSTANANHLTAANAAVATNVDNPFNANEYAIVTSTPVYSAGNTTCTVFTGQTGGIPNETLGVASYSTARAPFGFPANRNLWSVESHYLNDTTTSSPVIGTYYNNGVQLQVPTGAFSTSFRAVLTGQRNGAAGDGEVYLVISDTANTGNTIDNDKRFKLWQYSTMAASGWQIVRIDMGTSVTNNSPRTLYVNIGTQQGMSSIGLRGSAATTTFTAECAYL